MRHRDAASSADAGLDRSGESAWIGARLLITQRPQALQWLSEHGHGRYSVKTRLAALIGLAFVQVDSDVSSSLGYRTHNPPIAADGPHESA
jgi:hypothetical protein